MRTSTHRDEDYVLLAHDVFRFVSDWWYFAILSLAETDDFDAAPWAIARRLGISREQAQEATETLLRLGMEIRKLSPAAYRRFWLKGIARKP